MKNVYSECFILNDGEHDGLLCIGLELPRAECRHNSVKRCARRGGDAQIERSGNSPPG